MPTSVQRTHEKGTGRFGANRWAGHVLEIVEAFRQHDIDPATPKSQELIAATAWATAMYAWGAETAHTVNKPCSKKSVGIIIHRGKDLLLVERLTGAIGMACPAGHVDEGETPEQAARRETLEETGLTITTLRLVAQGRRYEHCKRWNSTYHDWFVYEASVEDFNAQHNPTESKRLIFADPDLIMFLRQRTDEYLQHIISEEEWKHQPGFERVWYWWLLSLQKIHPHISI